MDNEQAHMAVDAEATVTISVMGDRLSLSLSEAKALFNELGRLLEAMKQPEWYVGTQGNREGEPKE